MGKESLDKACTIENFKDGAEFGYNQCKDKLDIAIEIIEQMKDLFFDYWQEKGLKAIKFEHGRCWRTKNTVKELYHQN